MEGYYQCVHTICFSEPTKIGSLKTDRVNKPLHYEKTKLRPQRITVKSSDAS